MGAEKPERMQVSEEQRDRIWELHLRGMPKLRIAKEVKLHRETVARVLKTCYRDLGQERKDKLETKLSGAIARMRLIQEQAWHDHDVDDEREAHVMSTCMAQDNDAEDDATPASKPARKQPASNAAIRFQSQRSQYLRIALDAEREIARLEGLYESVVDDGSAVVFRIERIGQGHASASSDATVGTPDSENEVA